MELPPLQQQQLSALARSLGSSTLIDLSQLKVGSIMTALVEKTIPIDQATRQRLIDLSSGGQTSAEASNKAATNTPQANTQTARQALLNTPQLFAVELKVLGKQAMAFTEARLAVNSKISVSVRPDGQLQLAAKAMDTAVSSPTTDLRGQDMLTSATSLSAKRRTEAQLQQTLSTLNEGLRRYLPKQIPLSESLSTLNKLDNLPKLSQNSPLLQIVNALRPLLEQTSTIEQLTQPQTLKKAIQNSGAFLESKLAQNTQRILNNTQQSGTVSASEIQPKPDHKGSDNKAIILQALSLLPLLAQPTTNRPQASETDSTIAKLIQAFLSLAPELKEKSQLTKPELNAIVHKRLQNLLSSGLARISSMQIQHLSQTLQEGHSWGLGGTFELPTRLGDTIYPLVLSLYGQPLDETEEEKNKKKPDNETKKQMRWHVYLEFDLYELGIFASEISVQEQNIKATLWVQKKNLWQKSTDHLQSLKQLLEESGVNVESITCQHSSPPKKNVDVQRTLVDIKT